MAGIIAYIRFREHQDYVDRYLQGRESLCLYHLRSVFYFKLYPSRSPVVLRSGTVRSHGDS